MRLHEIKSEKEELKIMTRICANCNAVSHAFFTVLQERGSLLEVGVDEKAPPVRRAAERVPDKAR